MSWSKESRKEQIKRNFNKQHNTFLILKACLDVSHIIVSYYKIWKLFELGSMQNYLNEG